MSGPHTRFYLDKQNGKWNGVCAGLADYFGIDVTMVRTGAVISALVTGGNSLIVYWIIAWMAPTKPGSLQETTPEDKKFWQSVRKNPRRTARMIRSRFREIDRRLADVEAYVTSPNKRLEREIEALR
jgi:phage shock protein C